jgi:hypothetical protein
VAESYGLFLLGPLWLHGRGLPAALDGTERVDGRLCDVLQVWSRPGLGLSAQDRISLCVDRAIGLVRRTRFTLEGFAGTRGAVARVDTFDHESRFGVTVADAVLRRSRAPLAAARARLVHHRAGREPGLRPAGLAGSAIRRRGGRSGAAAVTTGHHGPVDPQQSPPLTEMTCPVM